MALAMVSATTVLIIACPCALGLATPMSVMVGVGRAAERGVLIRNGEALQAAAGITTMVIDKTGTLTEGKPAVTEVLTGDGFTLKEVLAWSAGLETGSEHPLATAVIAHASQAGIGAETIEGFNAIPGFGIEGRDRAGRHLLLGNEKLMLDRDVSISEPLMSRAEHLAEAAHTPMFLAVEGVLAAILAVADPVRQDTPAAVGRLRRMGIRVVMLTGDNEATASAVASAAGVESHVSGVLPEAKAERVAAYQAAGEVVGMAGDGINDAPALAQANVGFAVGTGTDIAIESADITLMRGSLHGLADAIMISRATLSNIRQNLFGAFVYNTAGVPVAAGILYPFFGILLSPVIAGAAMALSSFTVVSNAGRLRFFRFDGTE
jgi:Cu+-exporting ATPase